MKKKENDCGHRIASRTIKEFIQYKIGKALLERMQERDISIADVKSCLQTGEVIEDYPDDYPHPSCLIFGRTEDDKILHIVVG